MEFCLEVNPFDLIIPDQKKVTLTLFASVNEVFSPLFALDWPFQTSLNYPVPTRQIPFPEPSRHL
jgi:hypothetical protein